ncbi:gamma-glutamyl-gamma-aminobutyrate hydrolase family protein [Microbacterium sp. KUDC0406]|nr:gamma-glutamyl-gamma-aminobutyrate hydrolase family protein [Microbacterium sp. KUDC0406]
MPDDDDRAPWLAQERVLAREAIDADLPTLGICLGGQLLAHVAGGEVRASFGPKERGATLITPSSHGAEDAVLSALEDAAHMIENHQDMITVLPRTPCCSPRAGPSRTRPSVWVRTCAGCSSTPRWAPRTSRAGRSRPPAPRATGRSPSSSPRPVTSTTSTPVRAGRWPRRSPRRCARPPRHGPRDDGPARRRRRSAGRATGRRDAAPLPGIRRRRDLAR